MTTVRERVLQAVETKLKTISGVKVFRNLKFVPEADMPALVLNDGPHQRVEVNFTFDIFSLDAEVLCFCAGAASYAEANELLGKAHEVLTLDQTLGGVASEVEAGDCGAVDGDESDSVVVNAAVSMPIRVGFLTAHDKPSVLYP